MAITGTQISTRVGILLNDTSLVRWDAAERLVWINDGRREMASLKPTIFGNGTKVTHTLAAGCYQRIDTAGAYQLKSIDSNNATGKAIRPTTQQQLDAFKPGWRADTGTEVQNWFPDETDPLGFWVYPAVSGAVVDTHVWITPTDLATLSDTALPFDQYEPALVNYVCYRALSKEDEAGMVAKATGFYSLFTSALSPTKGA